MSMKNINKINKIDRTIENQNKLKNILHEEYDKKTLPLFFIVCFFTLISFVLLTFLLLNISIFMMLPGMIKACLFLFFGYHLSIFSSKKIFNIYNKKFKVKKTEDRINQIKNKIAELKIEKIKIIKNLNRTDFVDIEKNTRNADLLDEIIFEYENNQKNNNPYDLINEVCDSLYDEYVNDSKFDPKTIIEIRKRYYQTSKKQREENQKNAINRIVKNNFEIENC